MENSEGYFIKINLQKAPSWLFFLKPHKNISSHIKCLSQALDNLQANHENIILIGDLNVHSKKANISDFLDIYNIKNLVKSKICHMNPETFLY